MQATERFTAQYKRRVFNAIWVGQVLSIIGSGLTGFAVRVWAFERTGSVTQFSLITFLYGFPGIILSPFAGTLADRFDRRLIMILSDTGVALSTASIWLLISTGRLEVWHIYIAVALMSVCGAFQMPAYSATIPLLVPKEDLGKANGMMQIGPAVGRIISPLFAGMLIVTIGLRGITQLDLATFMFAILVLFMVRIPKPPRDTVEEKGSFWEETAFGWRFIKERHGLFALMLLFMAVDFTQGMVVVLIAPIVLSFADASVLGIVFSVSGFGALFGALTMGFWGGPQDKIKGLLGFSLLRALMLFLGGFQANVWLIAIASAFYLFCTQIMVASLQSIWQVKVPLSAQGRVFATRHTLAAAFFPLGQILSGPLADYLFEPLLRDGGALVDNVGVIIGVGPGRGIGLMLITLGVFNFFVTVAAFLYPRIRHIETELPDMIEGLHDERSNN